MNIRDDKIIGVWEARDLKLLLIIFCVALAAKGGVLARGFAVDDYSFGQGFTEGELGFFLTQGRFLLGGIDWTIDSLGVNINDLYVSLGLVALFLQAALVVAILRFVGAADAPAAMLVGSIMVAHPYLAEILTFRMVLPGYCVAAALSILALEAISRTSSGNRGYIVSLLAVFAMLFVYQGFLNYFAVVIIFTYLFGLFAKKEISRENSVGINHNKRAAVLTVVCAFSTFLFLAIISVSKRLGLIEPSGRANFIEFQTISSRLEQIFDLLLKIFWQSEPVAPHWIKVLIMFMMLVAVFALVPAFVKGLKNPKYTENTSGALLAAVLLIPAAVGVILPFKDWWPVPRVLPQIPVILGLLFLLAHPSVHHKYECVHRKIMAGALLCVAVAFVFLSNQIFADQQRLNSWDRMEANRIIARLERQSTFSSVEYVYVSGGSWRHSARLNTVQGDMNISAFSPQYSKIPLLLEVSGYSFKKAFGPQIPTGESRCASAKAWPDMESISVVDNLAIVCLPK